MNQISKSIIKILEDNNYLQESLELKKALQGIDSDDAEVKAKSINKIEGFCSIKSFGNLHITTMNGWAWNTLLEKLEKKVKR